MNFRYQSMSTNRAVRILTIQILAVACLGITAADRAVRAADEIHAAPLVSDVRSRITVWVADRGVSSPEKLQEVGNLWASVNDDATSDEVLDAVIQTFAMVEPAIATFVNDCRLNTPPIVPPAMGNLLSKPATDKFDLANLRLFYARYLTHRRMYEAALEVLVQIEPDTVVDPVGYLFYRAVCEHRLLMKTAGLKTIEQLLKNTEDVPVRYTTVATLMQYDLEAMREDSLDEIARKMSDVERRLDLGRGGQKVQKVEDEIIAGLDDIIKKLEQQSSSNSSSGSGGGQNQQNQSSNPADESRVKGTTAPGEVDEKDIGRKAGWGALPPKDEARAKNLINRNFPAHYRQAIEQYFKKLATRRASNGR